MFIFIPAKLRNGLATLKNNYNPMRCSTFGFGPGEGSNFHHKPEGW